MKAKTQMSSSKKVLIASLLVGVLLIGAIVGIVAVFAAQIQNVSSDISVTYVVDGVAAKVSATYATVPNEGSVTKLSMTGDAGNELTFNSSDAQTEKNLNPGEISLTSTTSKVVYEYKFTNIAESAFTVTLTENPIGDNMNVYYKVSATEIAASAYQNAATFSDTTKVATQAVVELNRDIYIYIVAEVKDINKSASYNGTMEWTLLYVAPETLVEINLDNNNDGAADDTMKIVPNVAMPLVYDKPTSTDGGAFGGYATAATGGTLYVNSDGTSAHVADLAAGSTLVALWTNIFYVEGTTIVGLTAEGMTQTKLVIPSNITAIADGAFENNSVVETITYEGAETATAAYADVESSLVSIGANACKNCTSLKRIAIPESVTSIGSMAFAYATALEEVYYNAERCEDLINLATMELVMPFAYCGTSGDGIIVIIGKDAKRIPAGLFIPNLLDEAETMASIPKTISLSFEENSVCQEIGMGSFGMNVYLETVTFPASLAILESQAFMECQSLTSAEVANTQNWYMADSLTPHTLGDAAYNAAALKSLIITIVNGTLITSTKTNSSGSNQYLEVDAYKAFLKYDSVEAAMAGDEYIILRNGESVEIKEFILNGNDAVSSINVLTSAPSDLETKLFYTNYGLYPQTYVGDSLNATLKNATLTATGKTYTTDISNTATTLTEYEYNGTKYAKLTASSTSGSDYIFADGTAVADSQTYFFKVEPIVVKAMESKGNGQYVVMAVNLLGSTAFEKYESSDEGANGYNNSWKNSDLRTYLNTTFLTESGLSDIAVSGTIKNEDLFNTSPDDSDTTDQIWLPSAEEIVSWYGSDWGSLKASYQDGNSIYDENASKRMKKPSDMAIATYAYLNTDGTGWYFLRSAGDDGNYVCGVNYGGRVYTNYYYGNTHYGFSPAFYINL